MSVMLFEMPTRERCKPGLHVFSGTWQYAITPDWLRCDCSEQTWADALRDAKSRLEMLQNDR